MTPLRVDRKSWATAILREDLFFGFKGIARWTRPNRDYGSKKKLNQLQNSLLYDEQYMETLYDAETKYVTESDDYAAEWLEYANRKGFELDDDNKKGCWARDLVDYDWVASGIDGMYGDIEGVAFFLQKHPVDAVHDGEEWVELDGVIGYCLSCCRVISDAVTPESDDGADLTAPHAFQIDCEVCLIRNEASHQTCYFDENGSARRVICCPHCGNTNPLDCLDLPWMVPPFYWPSGAYWPPHQDLTGYPLEMPDDEENFSVSVSRGDAL